MISIYFLTLLWFLFVAFCYVKDLSIDDLPSGIWLSLAIVFWPITAAILAGVQLSDFFNRKHKINE